MTARIPGSLVRRSDEIPYKSGGVTFVSVDSDTSKVRFTNMVTEKREMLLTDPKWFHLYAAWTGQWKTDLFEVDRKLAAEQVALKGRT